MKDVFEFRGLQRELVCRVHPSSHGIGEPRIKAAGLDGSAKGRALLPHCQAVQKVRFAHTLPENVVLISAGGAVWRVEEQ